MKNLILILSIISIISCSTDSTKNEILIKKNESLIHKNELLESRIEGLYSRLKEVRKTNDKNRQIIDSLSGKNKYILFNKRSYTAPNVYSKKLGFNILDTIATKESLGYPDDKDPNYRYDRINSISYSRTPPNDINFMKNLNLRQSFGNSHFYLNIYTVYNEKSLPLETENSNEDIYIFMSPHELGYEPKYFKISDYTDIKEIKTQRTDSAVYISVKSGVFQTLKQTIYLSASNAHFIKGDVPIDNIKLHQNNNETSD
ncbi:MAG: hypothetical protein ACPGRE_00795 [Flavobacteriaceae bacterium]